MSDTATPRIFTRFDKRSTLYMSDVPVAAGGRSGSYIFERQQIAAAGHIPTHTFDTHIFMLPMCETAVPFTSSVNGRLFHGLIEPGRFRFMAVGSTLSTTWEGEAPMDSIFIALHPELLHHTLGEEASALSIELVSNIMPHQDLLLAHLTLTMQSYLLGGRVEGRLFEHSLLTAIAAHLVTAYGSGTRGKSRNIPLTRQKRALVEDYVHQNLAHNLSLNEIAGVVGLSPRQLCRGFRAVTGQSLWQFVIECRARGAMRMMIHNRSLSLSYVACACGFESYSQFIAAFRRVFGQLPSEYRRTRRG